MSSPVLISDIAEWSWKRLKRTDLQETSIENAWNFYMLLISAVPFEEYETLGLERSMTSGTSDYDISDLSISAIESVRLTYSSGRFRRMRRSHTRVYDALGSAVPGVPATYARFGKTLVFNPTPQSSDYTYRLRYQALPDVQTDPDEMAKVEVIIPSYWHELMRYETHFRNYMDIEEFEKANMLVAPMPMPRQGSGTHRVRVFEYGIIPKLWNDMLRTVKQREGWDEDFNINPVVRRYTTGG